MTGTTDDMIVFNQVHYDGLRRDGYIIVEKFIGERLLKRVLSELSRIFPSWEEFRDHPEKYPSQNQLINCDFPQAAATLMSADALNDVALHAHLLDFVRGVETR